MLNKINKIKPELKFNLIKKFQEDLNYSFLYKRNKISNKKLLNWSTYNTLNFLQRTKKNFFILHQNEYSYINQDYIFINEKIRLFFKKFLIFYFFCKIFKKKNYNLNIKKIKPLITSILLKSFLLKIRRKLGKKILFEILSKYKYYKFLIKNLNLKKKIFNISFFNKFFKFFYNVKNFFLYKALFFVVKKKAFFFLQKYLTIRKWFSILILRNFNEFLNCNKVFKTKNIRNKRFRYKIEKKLFFLFRYKIKKKKIYKKVLYLKKNLNLKNLDIFAYNKYKNLNNFLKKCYFNSYKIKNKKKFKKFPIIQSLRILKYVNKSIFLIKKYKYILKKSLKLNILNKNSKIYFRIFKIYLKNLKFLYLVLNDFKIRSKFLKILDYGKYKKKIKNRKDIYFYKRLNRRFKYFFKRAYCKKKKKYKKIFFENIVKKKKNINIFEKSLEKSQNLNFFKNLQFFKIFIIRKKIKKYTKKNYLIYSKKSVFKYKMIYLQKLSYFLGKMKKKYIKKYIKESLISKNNSVNNFLISLESRIDVILFRLGFFRSFNEVKIFIKKGNVILNNKKILKNCSVRLNKNDIFTIMNKEKIMFKLLKDSQFFLSSIFQIPEYIEFNFLIFSGIFLKDLLEVNKVYYPISINKKNLVLKNSEIFRDILK